VNLPGLRNKGHAKKTGFTLDNLGATGEKRTNYILKSKVKGHGHIEIFICER